MLRDEIDIEQAAGGVFLVPEIILGEGV